MLTNLSTVHRARDMTQRQLAKAVGTEHTAVSRWERGEHSPSLDMALKIAAVLGTTVEDLAGQGADNAA